MVLAAMRLQLAFDEKAVGSSFSEDIEIPRSAVWRQEVAQTQGEPAPTLNDPTGEAPYLPLVAFVVLLNVNPKFE